MPSIKTQPLTPIPITVAAPGAAAGTATASTGVIAGGVVGGLAGLALLAFSWWLYVTQRPALHRRRKRLDALVVPTSADGGLGDVLWHDLVVDRADPKLGKGSFGYVFRGEWHPPRGVTYEIAVKVVSRKFAELKDFSYDVRLEKGREEAALVQSLSARSAWFSDCIINVYGFADGPLPPALTEPFDAKDGEVCHLPCRPLPLTDLFDSLTFSDDRLQEAFGIVMRLEGGGSLEDHLYRRRTEFTMAEKVRILAGISKGLAALHSANVVHADLKPANVLLSGHNPPEVRLSDFGLSKQYESMDTFGSSLFQTDGKRGTIGYCAPEMLYLEDTSGKVV